MQYIESSQNDPMINLVDNLDKQKSLLEVLLLYSKRFCSAPSVEFGASYLQKHASSIAAPAKIYSTPSSMMLTLCTQKKAPKTLHQGETQVLPGALGA